VVSNNGVLSSTSSPTTVPSCPKPVYVQSARPEEERLCEAHDLIELYHTVLNIAGNKLLDVRAYCVKGREAMTV
jgi:hypothetical protein